jgi:hypothetical protein
MVNPSRAQIVDHNVLENIITAVIAWTPDFQANKATVAKPPAKATPAAAAAAAAAPAAPAPVSPKRAASPKRTSTRAAEAK